MSLILFGFKGSGKTYFGKILAKELQLDFLDTDDLILELYEKKVFEKLSCRQISIKKGEAFFRALEKEAIGLIQTKKPSIIACGGGAILDSENYKHLQKLGTLIYLEADKGILKKRILSGELPSFLNSANPEESFEKMYLERKPLYEAIDAIKISTVGKHESQIVEEIKRIPHG